MEFRNIENLTKEEIEEELLFIAKFHKLYCDKEDRQRMLILQVYLDNKKYIKIKKEKDDERLTQED